MRSTLYLLRRGFRHRWAGSLVLVALLAVTGAAVLTAWAGARRTDTAFPRMLEATGAEDASVSAFSDLDAVDPAAVAGIDGVVRSGVVDGYGGLLLTADSEPDLDAGILSILVPDDAGVGNEFAGFVIDSGRLPAPDRPDEVLVSPQAEDAGIGAGTRLPVCILDLEEFGEPDACDVQELHVVGVGTAPGDIVVNEQTDEGENGFLTTTSPAFTTDTRASFRIVVVDLAPGTDLTAFTDAVGRAHPDGGVSVQVTEQHTLVVERAVAPYSRALSFFAAAVALTALGILGPALVRTLTVRDDEQAALRALGFETRQRVAVGAMRGAIIGAVAAVTAVGIGIALSGLFPVGPVRDAEPDPGLSFDALAVSLVGAAIVVFAVGAGVFASRPRRSRAVRRSVVADRLASAGAPPSAVIGVQAAFRSPTGTGGTLAAITSTAVAAAAVAAALVFGAGLTHLLDEPERFGFAWDGIYQAGDLGIDDAVMEELETSPLVRSVARGGTAEVNADGITVGTIAMHDADPDPSPVVLDGRLPQRPDEVAAGVQTLDRLGKGIGDRVELQGESGAATTATIVGTTLLPITARGDDFSVGEGMLLEKTTMDSLGGGNGFALFDTVPGANTADVAAAVSEETGFAPPGDGQIGGPNPTGDLVSYDRVRWVPLALASLLALLGIGVLTHTLITSTRAHRRELAVLRCFGFRRRDVVRTTAWQGGALALACLIVGLPVGVGIGRAIWEAFADSIGVVPSPVTPTLGLLVVAATTLILAIVVACLSGLSTARRRVGSLLRVE